MNKLQRMIAFAERYNLAWDDPDFDRIYEFLISAGHERASRVAAMQSEGHELGCPSLYDREYAKAYEHYHKEGTAKAAERGLAAGCAEDYAAKYAHADAYACAKEQVASICRILADGLPATAIYKCCSVPKAEIDAPRSEVDALIAKVQAEQ